jgi:hypothetical protein
MLFFSSQQYLSFFPPAITNVRHFERAGAEHESSADEVRLWNGRIHSACKKRESP